MKRVPIWFIVTIAAATTCGYWVDGGSVEAIAGFVLCFVAGAGARELDKERAGGGQ